MSSNKQAVAHDSLDALLQRINKQAERGGETSHPVGSLDDGTMNVPSGPRAAEHSQDIKTDQGALNVEDAPATANQDSVQPNLGLQNKATGEDPSNETASLDTGHEDSQRGPDTQHPANTENSEVKPTKYSAAQVLGLIDEAVDAGRDVLAALAVQPGQKQASQQTASEPAKQAAATGADTGAMTDEQLQQLREAMRQSNVATVLKQAEMAAVLVAMQCAKQAAEESDDDDDDADSGSSGKSEGESSSSPSEGSASSDSEPVADPSTPGSAGPEEMMGGMGGGEMAGGEMGGAEGGMPGGELEGQIPPELLALLAGEGLGGGEGGEMGGGEMGGEMGGMPDDAIGGMGEMGGEMGGMPGEMGGGGDDEAMLAQVLASLGISPEELQGKVAALRKQANSRQQPKRANKSSYVPQSDADRRKFAKMTQFVQELCAR